MASLRTLFFVFSLLVAHIHLAVSQVVTTGNQIKSFSELTGCRLACFVAKNPPLCAISNTTCQCQSAAFATDFSRCLIANCTSQDGLDAQRVRASLCRLPHPDPTKQGMAVIGSLFAVSCVAVLLRCISRKLAHEFLVEDIFVLLALASTIPVLVPSIIIFNIGYSRHIYDLQDGALKKILELVYIIENFSIVTLTFVKVTIICMFLRCFSQHGWFRAVAVFMMLTTLLANGTVLVLTILTCHPIEHFWDKDGNHNGTCLDVASLSYSSSSLAVAQDIVLLIMPIIPVLAHNWKRVDAQQPPLPLRSRLFLASLFALGALATASAIARLYVTVSLGETTDSTFASLPVAYWTMVEITAGIIITCMPALRTLTHIALCRFGLERPPDHDQLRGSRYYLRDGALARRSEAESPSDVLRVRSNYRNMSWDEKLLARPAAQYCHPAFDPRDENGAGPSGDEAQGATSVKMTSIIKYHLPRASSRRKVETTVTDMGMRETRTATSSVQRARTEDDEEDSDGPRREPSGLF